jgi:outer membrane protein OmpA-like peptidoglycan-associated protein
MTPERPEPIHDPANAARIWQMYADEIGLPAAPATPASEAAPTRTEVLPQLQPQPQRRAVPRARRRALLAASLTAAVVVLALRPEVRRLVAWPTHRVVPTRALPKDQGTTELLAKRSPTPPDAASPVVPIPTKTVDAPRLQDSPAAIASSLANPAPTPVPTPEPAPTQAIDVATPDVRPASWGFPYRITFEFDSDRLSGESMRTLQRISTAMRAHPEWRLRIEGHADAYGTPEHNVALSQRRALAAKEYLASAGIPEDRLSVTAYGASRPLGGKSDQPAFLNRRVEFYRR